MEALWSYVKFYGPDAIYWIAVAVVFELATLGTKEVVRRIRARKQKA